MDFYSKPKSHPDYAPGPQGKDKMLNSGMDGIKITDRATSALFS